MKIFIEEKVVKTRKRLHRDAKQRLLGVALIILGIACIAVFHGEDGTAGAFLVFLGTIRAVFKD